MNEKWIPGPWWVESDADEEVEGTLYICHEGTDSPDTTICAFEGYDKDDEANAHLIAAAPEMYEALKLALHLVEMSGSYRRVDIADKCKAALKKARGEE